MRGWQEKAPPPQPQQRPETGVGKRECQPHRGVPPGRWWESVLRPLRHKELQRWKQPDFIPRVSRVGGLSGPDPSLGVVVPTAASEQGLFIDCNTEPPPPQGLRCLHPSLVDICPGSPCHLIW